MLLEMKDKAGKCLGGAQVWVGSRGVANSLAANAILLVVEFQDAARDGVDVRVIQRSARAVVRAAIEFQGDMLEAEGLRVGLLASGVEIFARAEEPEEADDEEVDEVALSGSEDAVGSVEDPGELAKDVNGDRVGSGRRGVFLSEAGNKSFE